MTETDPMLGRLLQLLKWKKSKKFYAEKLGVSEEEVEELLRKIREEDQIGEQELLERFEENIEKGSAELTLNTTEQIKTLEELVQKCNIDTSKWNIVRYVQNFWGSPKDPHYQVKAWLSRKSEEHLFQDSFVEFLSTAPSFQGELKEPRKSENPPASLVINKQDAHLNKYDIQGNNSMEDRFEAILDKTIIIVRQACLSNFLEQITYILGSDEFNSEFTGTTTKGTPQQNIYSPQVSFEKICAHEVKVITSLLRYTDHLYITYVAGNHDEYAGWYMMKWLESYFRNIPRISFDVSPTYRKYVSYGNTAMMFNHGDALKPQKLASLFPIEYREKWSQHHHFYIFTGDKHHEMSLDMNGIKFYQLPALSPAKSLWDDKNGYTASKAEMTGFLIDREQGMTNIFKQYL